uniref:Protein disulfide-isomerase n=1 Tax=Lygus hesperus TaxID=30085 RepID=A0A0A9WIA6_LYGHE
MLSVVLFFLVAVSVDSVFSGSLELTDNDFKSRIGEFDSMLIMFYAPWCGHCKKLKPEFELAADLLRENDPPVELAKVDCTEGGKATCTEFGVSGYPTLKIFKNGKISKEYQGPRDGPGIVKYMASQVGPSAKEITSVEAFEKFLSAQDNSVVGFFKSASPLKEAFLQAADGLREKFRFAVTELAELVEKHDTSDGIILFRPKHLQNIFEPNQLKYDGDSSKSSLEAWLKKKQHGLVDHRTRDNTDEFKNPVVVAYYKVDYAKNEKGTNYWRNRILKVAKNFADDFTFAVSSKDDFQHELNEFGYDYVPSEKPIVFARNKDNKKFSMTEEFSIENFETFLKKLKNNELEPYLKSEPIPEDNTKPVIVAVGKNFDEVVTNNNKDTLIEFYAPWCGHCKKLTPVWDELGEKMAGEDVAIVKMDATNNDVPSPFEVRGFPTIYWASKDGKASPVTYNGGRELNDFVKYIAKHATSELKNYDRSGNPKNKDEL